jgi:hypothetical protein
MTDDLRACAPEAFAAFDVCFATVDATMDARLVAQARALVARTLGDGERATDAGDVDRAVRTFAAQFVIDVGSMTDEQRTAATAVLGAQSFDVVQLLYLFDWETRLRAAFAALFGANPLQPQPARAAGSLWEALEATFAAVARRRVLDPLTTEIVRLRGARAHNCRLCKSLRNVRPANDGVDEAVYDQIDHYETSALDERHKVALRLTDALLWQPLKYPAGLREQVRATFTDAEAVELVLDVARNAANKIAVALAADAPHVTAGVEYFDTDDHGELHYGLTPSS